MKNRPFSMMFGLRAGALAAATLWVVSCLPADDVPPEEMIEDGEVALVEGGDDEGAGDAAGPEALLASLAGTSWRLDHMAGRAAAEGVETTLVFVDGGRVTGVGGVNRYNGPFRFEDGDLRAGPFMSTRMAGPPEAMEQEHRFLELLSRAVAVERDGANLLVRVGGEEEPLRFVPHGDAGA